MKLKKLAQSLFLKYKEDPYKTDEEVRKFAGVREDRYYTVAVWPEDGTEGIVYQTKAVREVKAKKISKSNQPES